MTPPKRNKPAGNVEHHGRVTRRAADLSSPASYAPGPEARRATEKPARHSPEVPAPSPAPSARYTPPRRGVFRPGWHTLVGAAFVVVGLLVVIANDGMYFIDATLLPGGHNELYFFAGLILAGSGTWWFGWFDRTTPRRNR